MINNIGAEVKITFDMQIHMQLFTQLDTLDYAERERERESTVGPVDGRYIRIRIRTFYDTAENRRQFSNRRSLN